MSIQSVMSSSACKNAELPIFGRVCRISRPSLHRIGFNIEPFMKQEAPLSNDLQKDLATMP